MTQQIQTQPIVVDLTCYKGQSFSQNMYFKKNGVVFPLDGMTAKSQIRPSDNSETLIAEFICTITAEEGKLNISLDHETTAALRPGFYVWDLKTTSGWDTVRYWIRGKFIVSGRVTE